MRRSLHEVLTSMPTIEGYHDPWNLNFLSASSTRAIRKRMQHLPLTFLTGKACGSVARSFSTPYDALEDFIYHVVRDWRFEHWASFSHNHIFMDGVRRGYELDAHSMMEPMDRFWESLGNFIGLNECGSKIDKSVEVDVEQLEITQLANQNQSAESQKFICAVSRADEDDELAHCKSNRRKSSSLFTQITPSPRSKSKLELADVQQNHTWKQVAGYGPWVFAYT